MSVHVTQGLLSGAYSVIRFNKTFLSPFIFSSFLYARKCLIITIDLYQINETKNIESKSSWGLQRRNSSSIDRTWVTENLSFLLSSAAVEKKAKGPFNYCPTLMKHKKLIILSAGSLLCILFDSYVIYLKRDFPRLFDFPRFSALTRKRWLDAVYITSLYLYILTQTMKQEYLFNFFFWSLEKTFIFDFVEWARIGMSINSVINYLLIMFVKSLFVN